MSQGVFEFGLKYFGAFKSYTGLVVVSFRARSSWVGCDRHFMTTLISVVLL